MSGNSAAVVKVKFLGYNELGGYVNYDIEVTDVNENRSHLVRRYREFRELHDQIKTQFPSSLNRFPPKKFFGSTDPHFLETRLQDLQRYMDDVLSLDPRCAALPQLAAFLRLPPQLVGEETAAAQMEPTGQRVLEVAKARMIDLSLSPNDFLESAEKEQRIKTYAQIIAGTPPADLASASPATDNVPLLHRPVPPHVMRVAERHSALPVFTSLPESEWVRMVSAPSVVSTGKTRKMGEALHQIVEILDPKRPIEDARHIRVLDFLNTSSSPSESAILGAGPAAAAIETDV